MIILGISAYYHDSAACLVENGKVIAAAAEERFTRKKHDNSFPINAINFCLDLRGIASNEIDLVCFYEKPLIKFERILAQHVHYFPKSFPQYLKTVAPWFNDRLKIAELLRTEHHYHGKVNFIPHHLSHAASSYLLSPFDEAAIVTIDGVGEWATTTIGRGKGAEIQVDEEIHFPHSLGLLYSTLTTYLGFSANDAEYKVMGLAAYGKPDTFRRHFSKLIHLHQDGSFSLDMKYFDYGWSDHMASRKLEQLFGYPSRKKEGPVYRYHADIAAALQETLEHAVYRLLQHAYQKYQTDKLCLAGGVALNSVLNGKILRQTPFKQLFIPPDPSDAGGAIGAALYASTLADKTHPIEKKNFSPYLGPDFTWYEIEKILREKNLNYELISTHKKLLKLWPS